MRHVRLSVANYIAMPPIHLDPIEPADWSALLRLVGRLPGLRTLELTGNGWSEVPAELWCMPNRDQLFMLDLSYNRLERVSPQIGEFTNLRELALQNNQLASVPETIGRLSQLRRLNVGNNQRGQQLPSQLGQLGQLQKLHIDMLDLPALPEWIQHLSSLEVLTGSMNHIKEIPGWIGGLSHLKELDLRANYIAEVPEAVLHLPHLEYLLLSKNRFRGGRRSFGGCWLGNRERIRIGGWRGGLLIWIRFDQDRRMTRVC